MSTPFYHFFQRSEIYFSLPSFPGKGIIEGKASKGGLALVTLLKALVMVALSAYIFHLLTYARLHETLFIGAVAILLWFLFYGM